MMWSRRSVRPSIICLTVMCTEQIGRLRGKAVIGLCYVESLKGGHRYTAVHSSSEYKSGQEFKFCDYGAMATRASIAFVVLYRVVTADVLHGCNWCSVTSVRVRKAV